MCDKIISENPFMLKYCPDKYMTQKMCYEAVDDFLPKLNFVPDWFVTGKIIKKFFTALYADENFGNVVFDCNEMGILNVDFNCIKLDDNNFDEDDPDTNIYVRLLDWHIKFEKHKVLKK